MATVIVGILIALFAAALIVFAFDEGEFILGIMGVIVAFFGSVLLICGIQSVTPEHYQVIEIIEPSEKTYDGIQFTGVNYTVYLIFDGSIYKCNVPVDQIYRFEVGAEGEETKTKLFKNVDVIDHELL